MTILYNIISPSQHAPLAYAPANRHTHHTTPGKTHGISTEGAQQNHATTLSFPLPPPLLSLLSSLLSSLLRPRPTGRRSIHPTIAIQPLPSTTHHAHITLHIMHTSHYTRTNFLESSAPPPGSWKEEEGETGDRLLLLVLLLLPS
jgi:hypothetical protein